MRVKRRKNVSRVSRRLRYFQSLQREYREDLRVLTAVDRGVMQHELAVSSQTSCGDRD
ncbi:hypothetical protein [Vibrio mediterranei]|uniref:hypothetical protein n=1 Tax=Vibrio mediterranei TaxID=689 RepID=UPI004068FE4F